MSTEPITMRPGLRLSTSRIEQVLISKIRRDGGTQPRAGLDEAHVLRLVEALESDQELPPVVLFFDGEQYWLADGFHRVHAYARRLGYEAQIPAEIRQGDRRAAVLYSVGANQSHGLPRSREDTRRAIETLLRDEEWGKWSDREIARQVGCNHMTVGSARQRLASSGEIRQIEDRTVARNGTVYTQAARPAPVAPAEPVRRCFDCGSTDQVEDMGGAVKLLCRTCHSKRSFVSYGLSHDAMLRGYGYRVEGANIKVHKNGMFVQWINCPVGAGYGDQAHIDAAVAWIEAKVKDELPGVDPPIAKLVAECEPFGVTITASRRNDHMGYTEYDAAVLASLDETDEDGEDDEPAGSEEMEAERAALPTKITSTALRAHWPAPGPCKHCGEAPSADNGIRLSDLCEGCYHMSSQRAPDLRQFNLESAVRFFARHPGQTGKRAELAANAKAELATLTPAAPPPSNDDPEEPEEPEEPLDRDQVLYQCRDHYVAWLQRMTDKELAMLALATWDNTMLDWWEATREQHIGSIADHLVDGASYDIDAGYCDSRLKRVAALLAQ